MSKSGIQEEEVCSEVPHFMAGLEGHACGELDCGNMNASEPYDEEEEDDDLVNTLKLFMLRGGQERNVVLGISMQYTTKDWGGYNKNISQFILQYIADLTNRQMQ